MPKFRFIGDPNDDYSGPRVLKILDLEFPRDEWVEVPEGAVADKLDGHNHFDADYGDAIASDGSMIDDLPKKRGWPKGKPRGPRKGADV